MKKPLVYGGLIMIVTSTVVELVGAGDLLGVTWEGSPIVTGAFSKVLDIIGGGLLVSGIFSSERRR